MAKKKKYEQPVEDLPLVAIDLGSNSIRAMAAKRIGPNMLHILGVEELNKFACVERGVITQTSNAGYSISVLLRLLANRLNVADLPTAFVLTGGRTMQCVSVSSKRDQVHKREISPAMLEDMEAECKRKIEKRYPEVAVLGIVPAYFRLDGVEQDERPLPDQRAEMLEGHYVAFVGRKEMETYLQKSFDQAGKSIEQTFVRPEALLSAFAAEDGYDVLQEGCAVLDFGAQTTTLTIFKGSEYLYNKVVPQGGYHITRLLEQQGIALATAEKLKCQFGFASAAQVTRNLSLKIPAIAEVGGVLKVSSEDLAYTISLKLEEMLKPLFEVLSTYEERIKTLYLTGGASMLQGMPEYLQQKTSMHVLHGAHDQLLDAETEPKYLEPTYSALVGALIMGADYRDEHKDARVKAPSLIKRLQNQLETQTELIFTEQH